jgi:hypothetical protein
LKGIEMVAEYFGHDTVLAAAVDYISHGMARDLEDFAITADVEPAWELEVITAYIDRINGLSALYPKMPDII